MSNKLKAGLVGVGHLGRVHLAKLQNIEEIEFFGFYDIDRQKAEQVSADSGAYSAKSLQEILDNTDLISVVVPTTAHHEVGMLVLEAGRHMFMEKPFTQTVKQGREILELADRRGLKVGVGHIERFNPAVKAVAKRLGQPAFIEAHRLNPFNPRGLDVAVILELMIHDIDLCLYFTGSEVEDIQASAVQVLSDKMDIANARLTFKSGCVANLTASRISPSGMRKIRIFQKDSYLSFDLKDKKVDSYTLLDEQAAMSTLEGFSTSFEYGQTGKKIIYNKPQTEQYDMIKAELREFILAVRDNHKPPVAGLDGLRALEIALEIEKKARQSLDKINANL